jgi:hypothetical protein
MVSSPQLLDQRAHLVKALVVFVVLARRVVERQDPVKDIVPHDGLPVAVPSQMPGILSLFCLDHRERAGGEQVPLRHGLAGGRRGWGSVGGPVGVGFGKGVGDDGIVQARRGASWDLNGELVNKGLGFDVVDVGEVDAGIPRRRRRHRKGKEAEKGTEDYGANNESVQGAVFDRRAKTDGAGSEDCDAMDSRVKGEL